MDFEGIFHRTQHLWLIYNSLLESLRNCFILGVGKIMLGHEFQAESRLGPIRLIAQLCVDIWAFTNN
ncbi:hypothetical protein CISIN_1g035361mg [Citrus sinensis]|uniref:Uncharacterized protein n=1 Tax=Citrus sinensis TaxID=2711 RepID=A0A067DKJ7_CITSI|nr:hypothetical protein CISIN_1g035361mg [Citrus sinensis]